jgi:hypothetical protein
MKVSRDSRSDSFRPARDRPVWLILRRSCQYSLSDDMAHLGLVGSVSRHALFSRPLAGPNRHRARGERFGFRMWGPATRSTDRTGPHHPRQNPWVPGHPRLSLYRFPGPRRRSLCQDCARSGLGRGDSGRRHDRRESRLPLESPRDRSLRWRLRWEDKERIGHPRGSPGHVQGRTDPSWQRPRNPAAKPLARSRPRC